MTDQNLISEIEEDVRRQQLEDFWKRWGGALLAGVVLLLLAVGGYRAYQHFDYKANLAATTALLDAVGTDAATREVAALLTAAEGMERPMPQFLARLVAAGAALQQQDTAKALEIYDLALAQPGIDPVYRDWVRLLKIQITLERAEPDMLHKELLELARKDAPLRFSALEMQGLLALRQGNVDAAQAVFTEIAHSSTAPALLKDRAGDVLRRLESPQ